MVKLLQIGAKNINLPDDEVCEERLDNFDDPLGQRSEPEEDEFMLPLWEEFCAQRWKVHGDLIVEIIHAEPAVIADNGILVNVALHHVLEVDFKQVAIVVSVLLLVFDVICVVFFGAEVQNGSAL